MIITPHVPQCRAVRAVLLVSARRTRLALNNKGFLTQLRDSSFASLIHPRAISFDFVTHQAYAFDFVYKHTRYDGRWKRLVLAKMLGWNHSSDISQAKLVERLVAKPAVTRLASHKNRTLQKLGSRYVALCCCALRDTESRRSRHCRVAKRFVVYACSTRSNRGDGWSQNGLRRVSCQSSATAKLKC